jgi:hypothetical protein
MRWWFGAFAGGVIMTAAGVAVAGNYTTDQASAFYSAGNHQFYVWCAGANSYRTLSPGRDAEDAQLRLYNALKAKGRTACWPVWQGKTPAD